MKLAHLCAVALIAGCGEGSMADTSTTADTAADTDTDTHSDSDADSDSDTDSEPETSSGPSADPAEPVAVDSCPDLSASTWATFSSGRTARVYVPSGGAESPPLLFLWHYLGGTSDDMAWLFDAQGMADQHGAVVIAPDASADNIFEWDFWNGETDDLNFYDELRACAAQELEVDLRRVYASGVSAGALWTTQLSLDRGDTLAAVLPFSGGTFFGYNSPTYAFPALLMWGGDSDTYGLSGVWKVDFQELTQEYSEGLQEDGHFVVHCNHEMGHTVPGDGPAILEDWLFPHTFGYPSPFQGSDPSSEFASYCYLP